MSDLTKRLIELAQSEDEGLRVHAASNPNTPQEWLAKLAKDDSEDIRVLAAQNPNTPAELLRQLAQDESDYVRLLAQNSLSLKKEIPREIPAENYQREPSLKITIDVDENISDERLKEIVREAVLKADASYQELGGSGLRIKGMDAFQEVKTPDGVLQ